MERSSSKFDRILWFAYRASVSVVVGLLVVGAIGRLGAGSNHWSSHVLDVGLALAAGGILGSGLALFLVPLFTAHKVAFDEGLPTTHLHAGFRWAAGPIPRWVVISGPILGLAGAVTSLVWRMQVTAFARLAFVCLFFGIPLISLLVMWRAMQDPPPADPPQPYERDQVSGLRGFAVGAGGSFLGFVLSLVIAKGISAGAGLVFPGDNFESPWAEHPMVRVFIGGLSSLVGGYVAGNVAPRTPRAWAIASGALPATLWLVLGIVELTINATPVTSERALSLASVFALPIATVGAAYYGGVVGDLDARRCGRSVIANVRVVHWFWLVPLAFMASHLAAVSTATALTSTFSYADLSLSRVLGIRENGWDWAGLPRPGEVKNALVGLAVGLIGAVPVKRLLAMIEALAGAGGAWATTQSVLVNLGAATAVVLVAQFALDATGWSPMPTVERAEERISRRRAIRYSMGSNPQWLEPYQRFAAELASRPEPNYSLKFSCGRIERPLDCENSISVSEGEVVLRVLRPWEESDGGVTTWEFRIIDKDANGVPDEAEIWEGMKQSCADIDISAGGICSLRPPRNDLDDPILESYVAWDMSIEMALEEQGRWVSGRRLLPNRNP